MSSPTPAGGPYGHQQALSAGDAAWFAERCTDIVGAVETIIRGKTPVVRLALICMLAEGHLLIQDVPGLGKTMLAKSLASAIGVKSGRIQFTPDLLPSDVTGVSVFNQRSQEFEFRAGPVFANVLLGDEINRASPKTQSALLEVMEERQVTVDGKPFLVPRPFVVLATQNPVESAGVYPLPEAQLDRFMCQISIGYPSPAAEAEILSLRTRGLTAESVSQVLAPADFVHMISVARGVHLAPAVLEYVVTVCAATRTMPEVRLGVSPRGALALANAAQAHAAMAGRTFVTPDDVKALARHVLAHRMLLRPEAELEGVTSDGLLGQVLASVPVPQQRAA